MYHSDSGLSRLLAALIFNDCKYIHSGDIHKSHLSSEGEKYQELTEILEILIIFTMNKYQS